MKRLAKISLFLGIVLTVSLIGSIYYFFQANEAPILKGDVDLCLPYKGELLVDIYFPTKEVYEKRPVLIYYHGGAWIVGGKESINNARFNEAFNILREKGYTIIGPNYTLGAFGKSPFPQCITDAFDAIQWVEEHADTYNFDLENVGVFGESAGGHLALMTAFAKANDFSSEINLPIQYVIDVYAPTDLHALYDAQQVLIDSIKKMTANFHPKLQERFDPNQYLFGFDPESDSLRAHILVENYSPISYIDQNSLPTLIIHGNKDQVVPISQSSILIEKLETHGVPYEYHELEGVDHAFAGVTDEQKANVQNWIADFVVKNYRN